MHVDDKIYADISQERILLAVRAAITANDLVLGTQDALVKPDATDFEKLIAEPISFKRILLGKEINTRTLMVSLPIDKRVALHKSLTTTWGSQRKSFTILEASQLAGTLINAVQCCRWGSFMFLSFMKALNQAISTNYRSMLHSSEYHALLEERDQRWIHPEATNDEWLDTLASARFKFFHAKVARILWSCKKTTFITTTIRHELNALTNIFLACSPYKWQAPISHLIKREEDYSGFSDACLKGSGGFSSKLTFWWQLVWPHNIQLRTILHLPSKDPTLLSINLLEYAGLIVTFAGAIVAIESDPPTPLQLHPLLQLWTDNTSADAWTRKMSSGQGSSNESQALAQIFCYMLMHWPIGVNSAHIAGKDNILADELSRTLNHHHIEYNSPIPYATPFFQIPQIRGWRCFQPSPELLNLLLSALCSGCVPIPTTRVPLGQLKDT
jgi:hypothetical protein